MTDEDAAYIAGFLDGDGSIMAQLVYRNDYKYGYQVRVSIVFYQKTIHEEILLWLQEQLHTGYIRRRRDGMSEYTIVGLSAVASVLTLLQSKLRLKKQLAQEVLKLIKAHPAKMTPRSLLKLAGLVDQTATFNYSKKRTITSAVIADYLTRHNFLPVETSSATPADGIDVTIDSC